MSVLVPGCCIHQYADDTQLYTTCTSAEADETVQKMNGFLERLRVWSAFNGLVLNLSKSSVVWVGTMTMRSRALSTLSVEVKLGDVVLEIKECVRNLCVLLDHDLFFREPALFKVRHCCIRHLYQTKHILPSEIKLAW